MPAPATRKRATKRATARRRPGSSTNTDVGASGAGGPVVGNDISLSLRRRRRSREKFTGRDSPVGDREPLDRAVIERFLNEMDRDGLAPEGGGSRVRRYLADLPF